jgi:hypothetical protein
MHERMPATSASSARVQSHPIARARRLAALALACGACATAQPAPPAEPEAPSAPGALRIELHFGADADLDLYVTDPSQETVYFANTPSRNGGRLRRDRRCADATPRVEVIEWDAPAPGRYRLGVDFPERCDDGIERARFRVVVAGPGLARELEGEAAFARFDARTLEFEIAP